MIRRTISVQNVTCRYLTTAKVSVQALQGVSFDLLEGEFVTVVGPSGAGKSSLLAIIAGLRPPTSGEVVHAEPNSNIGYLFQKDAVFPWRTVAANLSFSAEIAGASKSARHNLAEELCLLVGLNPEAHMAKFPNELSGGEIRRLSLGMALSKKPKILLLDEPTSSLDWLSRRQIQSEIQQLVWNKGITVVSVTHDVEEAIWLSNRIIVLKEGKIAATIDINLPHPRTHEMRSLSLFQALEDEVVAAIVSPKECKEVVLC